jgi:hypothetical protein
VELLKTILQQMSSITAPQRKFMLALFPLIFSLHGRINFSNLSRYSDFNPKTFSRWYRREFDFVEFNRLILAPVINSDDELIAATDCSFIPKNGNHTYGIGKFYNGVRGKAEKGLEISTIALVNVTENTAYAISTQQTPATNVDDETRVDFYLTQLKQIRNALPPQVRRLVADGYYSKKKHIDGVTALGLQQIGKLRYDANLRWLYKGEQKPRGRKRLYDGKVKLDELERFEFAGEMDNSRLYTAVVNSPHFDRNLRIVLIIKRVGEKVQFALLFSTELELAAKDIVRFYKARFQIEFIFRDAKQFLGLNDCQARCSNSLNFHFNASMTALNLLKLEDRKSRLNNPNKGNHVISIASWKIRKFNEHLLERFSLYLGLDFNSIKLLPSFEALCSYGVISV